MIDEIFFLAAAVTALAGAVQSITGFGFGIVAMIFLPSLLLYAEANMLSAILSTVLSLCLAATLLSKIHWKNLIFPILGSVPANAIAIMFVKGARAEVLLLLLGIALFLLSVYFFLFSDKLRIRPTWYAGLLAGVLSGALSGLFSIGGPPVVVYYMQSEREADRYLATISMYFVLSGAISIGMKAVSGFMTGNVWLGLAFGAAGLLLGLLLGRAVRKRISPGVLKKTVYGVMAASGLLNAITSLIALG